MSDKKRKRKTIEPRHGGAKEEQPIEEKVVKTSKTSGSTKQ